MALFGNGSGIGTGIIINLQDNFTANADKIAARFRTMEGASVNAAQTIEVALNKMKMGFGALVFGAAILTPLYAAGAAAMEFQQGMAKINTTAQLSQEELGKLRTELLAIGGTSTGDISKIPDAYEKIISQTGDVALSLEILQSATKGAQAGFTDIDTVAGALAQTLSIVGKENTNAAEVMNTLFAAKRVGAGEFKDFANYLPTLIAAASNLGYTFKETAGIFAYFTGKGQDAASSAMLMQNAFSALQKVDIQKGLSKVGVDIFDGEGKMRDIVSIFTDLNKVTGQMSQQQKTNLLDKVGLRDVQARNAFAILSSDLGKLQEAMAATANPAGELRKALQYSINPTQDFEIALNGLKAGFIELGTIFLPIATTAAKYAGIIFGGLGKIFAALTHNPIGVFILKLAGFIGVLSAAIGIGIIAVNLKNWAVGQLAQSLIALGKTEIATTFLTKGLAAGFIEAAAAAVPLLIEMAPFIAVGAAIAAAFYIVTESLNAFGEVSDGTAQRVGGFYGILQKIGGVITGVMEVWNSATTEGFSLSEKTAQALEKLGIYDFVVNLATWVVRLKAIFTGMSETISGAFEAVGKVIGFVWAQVEKLADALGFDMSKNLTDINKFIAAGKILGYVFLAAISPLIIAFALFSVAILIAIAPLILLGAIIYGLYELFVNFGNIVNWLGDTIAAGFGLIVDTVKSAFGNLLAWINDIPSRMADWGVSLVESMFSGIMSAWEWLKQGLVGLIADLPGGSVILNALGVSSGIQGGISTGSEASNMQLSSLGVANAESRVMPMNAAGKTETYNNTERIESVKDIYVNLDGKAIKANVDKRDKQQDSRRS